MTATLESVIDAYFEYKMRGMYTAIPAEVTGVRNLEESRIDCTPLVNTVYPSLEDGVQFPTILNVPLIYPSSSTSAVTFPVNVGDTVLLVFAQKSLDVFKGGTTSPHPPNDYRVFDKRDAIAIPCIWPFQESKNKQSSRSLPHNPTDMVVAHNLGTDNEAEIRISQDGKVKITALQIETDCENVVVNTTSAAITSTGTTTVSGNVVNVAATTSASVTAPITSVTATTSAAITSTGTTTVSGNVVNVAATTSASVTAPITSVNATTSATITSPIAEITAITSATITSPIITFAAPTGAVAVTSATFTWNGNTVAVV